MTKGNCNICQTETNYVQRQGNYKAEFKCETCFFEWNQAKIQTLKANLTTKTQLLEQAQIWAQDLQNQLTTLQMWIQRTCACSDNQVS